ncbi:putative glutathione S-transferase [Pyronema omphalodes]|nr:putative glutathione S-transferase [Pyronema omphalodes]
MSTTTATPNIKLYWLNRSRSQRILWLLEELNLPYELTPLTRGHDMSAPADISKQIHPLGKFPVLTINDQVLAESGLIVETLIARYGKNLEPEHSDEAEWLRYRYYMHYAEGSLIPPLVMGLVVDGIRKSPLPWFMEWVLRPILNNIASKVETSYLQPQYQTHFSFVESELQNRTYLAAEKLTGADIMMSFPLIAARGRTPGYTREQYPNIYAYLDRLEQREMFIKAAKRTEDLEGEPL